MPSNHIFLAVLAIGAVGSSLLAAPASAQTAPAAAELTIAPAPASASPQTTPASAELTIAPAPILAPEAPAPEPVAAAPTATVDKGDTGWMLISTSPTYPRRPGAGYLDVKTTAGSDLRA